MSKTKPALSKVTDLGGSDAWIIELVAESRDGTFEHTWHHKRTQPEMTWIPEQGTLLWIYPAPAEVLSERRASPSARRAYRTWTGRESDRDVKLQLPSFPLQAAGRAVRIVYRFKRDAGGDVWEHEFTTGPRFWLGSNKRGNRVFAVTGPGLRFTSRGIMG